MDRLTAMEIFVCVVEEKSFSAAATKLKISNSAVSKHVAMLEEEINSKLINRTTRRFNLTEAGKVYYESCKRILSDYWESNEAIAHLNDEPYGNVKLNAPVFFGVNFIIPLLPGFIKKYPKISIELSLTDKYIDMIDEGVDLLIRIGQLPDSTLIAIKLASSRTIVCATPEYLLKNGRPQIPTDLFHHNCFKSTKPNSNRGWKFYIDGEEAFVPIKGNFTSNNGDALLKSVKEGMGLARLPAFMIGDDIENGSLSAVLTDYEIPPMGIYALYMNNKNAPRKIRALIDFMKDHFSSKRYWE